MPQPRTAKATRRPRRYDPAKVREALVSQTDAIHEAVHSLCAHPRAEALLAAPTRLGEWTVADLVVHLCWVMGWAPAHLHDPVPEGEPLTLTGWALATRTAAAGIDEAARQRPAESPAALAERFDRERDALHRMLTGPEAADPERRVVVRFGTIGLADFLVTRLLETVVHADDLADAVERAARAQGVDGPVHAPDAFRHDRQALAAAARLLADTLAEAAPGGAVELRVPPYAVVQCVAGPRHTRGTPPNVVETDPLTWIRLATGRTSWADAVESAAVSASGERSDLSAVLPVMG
ncbi:sterol carrier family protein [Streptacidiphilus griseoplanus]|uniref:sterol carrier family protein n=1 Tax=Peterkaempfera griseoplana TaxID=66896 RepID=UPI0006E1AF4A|nr:sterol carrier family protein [Peterkaempfera griseoplana]